MVECERKASKAQEAFAKTLTEMPQVYISRLLYSFSYSFFPITTNTTNATNTTNTAANATNTVANTLTNTAANYTNKYRFRK